MADIEPAWRRDVPLAPFTTMRVGGPAERYIETRGADELVEAVRASARASRRLLVLGGGSNLLIGDEGFEGDAVRTIDAGDIAVIGRCNGRVLVRAGVGTPWDALVAFTVDLGLAGLEALSGIPGQIGSAVVQNIGAYGQEMSACLDSALLYDRATGETARLEAAALRLGYRSSLLRESLGTSSRPNIDWHPTPRWVVLEAVFALDERDVATVAHVQLARALGCRTGDELPVSEVRRAVLEVRRSKDMVQDDDPCGPNPCHNRWSSGSFFTNPVLGREEAEDLLPADAPRYSTGDPSTVKTSAAWLIEHAGFPKGYGVHGAESRATLSTKHTLAMTNRGNARAQDVVELARAVRAGVRDRFGVELEPESVLVGVSL